MDSLIDWDLRNHLVDGLLLVDLAEVGNRRGVNEGEVEVKQYCHIDLDPFLDDVQMRGYNVVTFWLQNHIEYEHSN
jgi:hypothetical protein